MFWENLKKQCELSGIKPTPLAEKIGVSKSIVSKWKCGTLPNLSTAIKLADYLNCSLDTLVGRDTSCVYIIDQEREKVLINVYRDCDEKGKARITQVALNEQERSQSKND